MKKIISITLAALMIITSLFCTASVYAAETQGVEVSIPVELNYDYANAVLERVNKERAARGIASVSLDAEMMAAAMQRAGEIVAYFSHDRPDGSACFTACSKMNGENIAVGYSTPEYVMEGWMQSQGHKDNILASEWKSIGIGVAKYGNTYFWVQCFGSAKATPFSKTGKEKKNIKFVISRDNFELYYNSVSALSGQHAAKGLDITIVCLNKGWNGSCFTIPNNAFDFVSSDETVFRVDENGTMFPLRAGKATLSVTMKKYPDITLQQEISVNNLETQPKDNAQTQTNVSAKKVKLSLKKVAVKKSAKKLVLQATLKIGGKVAKGKKVTFKFNGKKYTAKTNKKGVAKVTVKKSVLKKLKKGKKITYSVKYGKKTVKKTVKVK